MFGSRNGIVVVSNWSSSRPDIYKCIDFICGFVEIEMQVLKKDSLRVLAVENESQRRLRHGRMSILFFLGSQPADIP